MNSCPSRCPQPNHKCAEHAVETRGSTLTIERFHHADGKPCDDRCVSPDPLGPYPAPGLPEAVQSFYKMAKGEK